MTTMAALLGALPLALGTGQGHELRRPLGITIIGGLIASQLLTPYTTPVVYLLLDRLRIRLVAQQISRWPEKATSRNEKSKSAPAGSTGCHGLLIQWRSARWSLLGMVLSVTSCRVVGPNYVRPSAPSPNAYREQLPSNFKEAGWKGVGTPNDQLAKGKVVGDFQRPAVERARTAGEHLQPERDRGRCGACREARCGPVLAAKAGLYPTVTGNAAVTGVRTSIPSNSSALAEIPLTGTASWVPALWGQIHRDRGIPAWLRRR